LCQENYGFLVDLLWNIKDTNAINHPFYEFLAKELVEQKQIKDFWKQVEVFLGTSGKFREIVSVHFAVAVLKNLQDKPKDVLKILTPNFIGILVENSRKLQKNSEDLQDLYDEFYQLLDQAIVGLKKDETKLQVLEVLTKSPGSILLERSLQKKIFGNLVNSLERPGLKQAIEQLIDLVGSAEDFKERMYAANLLQRQITNKLVAQDLDFRFQLLQFLLNFGIFRTNNGQDLVGDDEWNKQIAKELTPNMRNLLFHSLEQKLPKLEDEKKLLLKLAESVDKTLSKKNPNKYLVSPLKESHIQVWQKMLQEVQQTKSKKDQKLNLVFHILLLHMGFQLFVSPDVAESAINELGSVLKRVFKKEKKSDEEPEWIEVVIDLFLNLLSQNSHVLRNVIRHIYPQLCDEITLTAFHQILEVLDLKNEENPLSGQENGEDLEESDAESEIEDELDETGEEKSGGSGQEESSEDDDDDLEGTEEELEDEDEEKATDKLRMAVQAALGEFFLFGTFTKSYKNGQTFWFSKFLIFDFMTQFTSI
jgi:DNA polymerase phi